MIEHIELVWKKLIKLAPHLILGVVKHLKSGMNDMNKVTALFLGYFSENYKFVVQHKV